MNSYAEDYIQILGQKIVVIDKEISKLITDLHNLNKTKLDIQNMMEQYRNEPQSRDSTDN